MKKVEDIVKDHLLYLDAVHEFTDWLHSAKEELHRWSDATGDTSVIQKKLAKINVRTVSYHNFICDSEPIIQSIKTVQYCSLFIWSGDYISMSWKHAF